MCNVPQFEIFRDASWKFRTLWKPLASYLYMQLRSRKSWSAQSWHNRRSSHRGEQKTHRGKMLPEFATGRNGAPLDLSRWSLIEPPQQKTIDYQITTYMQEEVFRQSVLYQSLVKPLHLAMSGGCWFACTCCGYQHSSGGLRLGGMRLQLLQAFPSENRTSLSIDWVLMIYF